jgi:hypothetical protein
MMKSPKEIKREAKHLFRLCFVNGSLDEDRVRGRVARHPRIKTAWLPASCGTISAPGEPRSTKAYSKG